MRVTEKLLLNNNRKKNKQKQDFSQEETMMYALRRKKLDVNQGGKGIFLGTMSRGINTEKSIFDRKATFHTDKKGMKG